jgi:16S rRNA (cytosine1402-N4)-methyltransferase
MRGDGGRDHADLGAVGGSARHVPVLREAVIAALSPRDGGIYLDGTFGAGGYSRAILATPGARVLALDRDPGAIAGGQDLVAAAGGRLTLVEARFSALDTIAAGLDPGARATAFEPAFALEPTFDGVALDIGVSSMQLDEPGRGFSFRHDGPLDMRMSGSGPTAADIVNTASAEEIADILYHYGEERASRRIARAIVADRAITPFTTTKPLAEMIARVAPAKPTDIHPATRTFQALRIAVNDELGELVQGLTAAEGLLKPGGVLAVVTFHSLEDRIVKQFFAKRAGKGEAPGRRLPGEARAPEPGFTLPRGQPVVADEAEVTANPRARSAKLRYGLRTSAPAMPPGDALLKLARLPQQGGKGPK